MAIAGWQRPTKRWRWITLVVFSVFLVFFSYYPIRRKLLFMRLARGLEEHSWTQVSNNLIQLWRISGDSNHVPEWLSRASFDLSNLQSVDVNTSGQVHLIQWLLDQKEQEIARLLLDQNTVIVPIGSFVMGSDTYGRDEGPMRYVSLSTYAIDRFEVTHLQYRAFIQDQDITAPIYWQGNMYPQGRDLNPVVGVSWEQACAYCQWAGKRLPTEAEWERACRGDDGETYSWGSDWVVGNANLGLHWSQDWPAVFDDVWQILASSELQGLQPIGSYSSGVSPYGLEDMIGNAAEWVSDWYNVEGYAGLPHQDPMSTGPLWNHVVRGNGWFSRAGWEHTVAELSRCGARSASHSFDDPRVGFRCAQDVAH
jgi:iron(II)-dependent oxidoreductase